MLHINHFPIFFGAVPVENISRVESFPLTIAICEHCHHVQQIKRLDEGILHKVYTDGYYNCPSPLKSGMGTREIDKFHAFFKSCSLEKGKLLEIGCFDGYLLLKLLNDGWDVYGCDPSPMTVVAKENIGDERITNDFFNKDLFEPNSFDVIIFRNLLEHLYNVRDFMKHISSCLKPGGRIFIDVPNVREIFKLGGFGIFFHQHVSYFSLHSLAQLLNQYHFSIEKYLEGDPNLFAGAVNSTDKPIIDNNSHSAFNIEEEVASFFMENRRIKKRVMDLFKDPALKNIAIFGASALSTTIINFLDKNMVSKIAYIFDNDSLKHGKYIYGCDIPITSPLSINNSQIDMLLISTYFFVKEIYELVAETGVKEEKIKTLI